MSFFTKLFGSKDPNKKAQMSKKKHVFGKVMIGDREYKTVIIGKQEWLAENVDVDCFHNGDPIPVVESSEAWSREGQKKRLACCYYENDPVNGKQYGRLYNWHAVNDPRGIAIEGWHVATDQEWKQLEKFLGMSQPDLNIIDGWRGSNEGAKLKAKTGWDEDGDGTNESGFSALPGGYRMAGGLFRSIGYLAYFWTATKFKSDLAWGRYLSFDESRVTRYSSGQSAGFSVRFVRDV